MRYAVIVVALGLCASACITPEVAKRRGLLGWFRADVPPTTGHYRERFAEIAATDPTASCSEVEGQQWDAHRPIVVLIPGAGGEGPEMDAAVARLMAWGPSSLYMFRWNGFERRDDITERLARGLSRIAECVPHSRGRIVVVGHSAGGVLASLAASRVALPPGAGDEPWIEVLTVGAMLAGNVPRPPPADGAQQQAFMLDLGSRISLYPAPAPGVRVAHLRTQVPGDVTMTPVIGLKPNDPSIGVPGAPQIDLPASLDHSGALQYVLRGVMEGRTEEWLAHRAPPRELPNAAQR